jgi:hypothetical protein
VTVNFGWNSTWIHGTIYTCIGLDYIISWRFQFSIVRIYILVDCNLFLIVFARVQFDRFHKIVRVFCSLGFYLQNTIRGKRFTVCTEIVIILGTVRFTIRGGRLRYKRYDAHFLKKSSVELPFSSFDDHLINILRKVNR